MGQEIGDPKTAPLRASATPGTVALGPGPSIRGDSRDEITPRPSPPPSDQFGLRRVPFPTRSHHPGGPLVRLGASTAG